MPLRCAVPVLQGLPHKTFTVLQGDLVYPRGCVEGLRSTPHRDDDGISCAVPRQDEVYGVMSHGTNT